MAPVNPRSCISFDADLDGDMDLFFVDAVSDNSGRVVYDRNPDIAVVGSQVIHFGTVQNRCALQRIHHFRNDGPFPATICDVTIPNPEGGVYTLVSPTEFPITVAPADSLPIRFEYTPCFSEADSGLARIAFYGGIGGCHQYSLYLYGRSGLAEISVLPDTLINFGYVERGESVLDSFQIFNNGTWALNGFYEPSSLNYFTFLNPAYEFVAPNETTAQRYVRFDAHAQSPDTVILERMRLVDSTLCDDCPDQPELSSRWIYFREHIITNRRPVFTFPSGALVEGASGILSVGVHDSNAALPRQRVVSRFAGLDPTDRSLSITADTLWQWQDTIRLPYDVADSVTWPLELFELSFAAIDTPVNEQVDTVWVLAVQATNDLPRFITSDDVAVIEGTNIVNWILATVGDEENNPLIGDYEWLGEIPSHATVTPPTTDMTFRLNWQTTFGDEGVYPLQLVILEDGNPARADTETVIVTVIDRPPNLAASLQVIPDTTTFYSTVSVSWSVHETDLVPVDFSFNVRVVQTAPDGDTLVLRNSTYPSLPAGGTVDGILGAGPLDKCGDYSYAITVIPTEPDANPNDDAAAEGVWVICPDLTAYVEQVPDTVERDETFIVRFLINETHGIAVQAPFSVALTNEETGDTLLRRNYAVVIEPWGTLADSFSFSSIGCGPLTIVLEIIPPTYYDDDPSNNRAGMTMRIWCPDLAVLRVTAPPQIHKHTSFRIDFVIGEVNGIDMESSFSASVFCSGVREDFYLDYLGALDSVGGSADVIAASKGILPILVKVNPPPGQDRNPLNDTLSTTIEVLADPFMAYPLPFTPNADRYNDTLYFAFGDEVYDAPVVKIFTIEGHLVRTLDHSVANSIEWDGRDDGGRECAPGPYLYTLDDGGKKISSGIVYVAR